MGQSKPLLHGLILTDISLLVAASFETGNAINLNDEIARLYETYPSSDFSKSDIAAAILEAARKRSAPIEVGGDLDDEWRSDGPSQVEHTPPPETLI